MAQLTLPHIGFEYPENYQDELVLNEVTPLREHGLRVDARKRNLGLMASIEWALPTAFVVYLFKPYFESFLKEAGKDSYEYVKKRLTQFIINKRNVKTVMINSSQSPNKLSKSYDQSHSISIHSRIHENVRITVLFHNHLDDTMFAEVVSGAIDSLLIIRDQFEKLEDSEATNKIIDFYMVMNIPSKTWELLTMQQMTEKYRNI